MEVDLTQENITIFRIRGMMDDITQEKVTDDFVSISGKDGDIFLHIGSLKIKITEEQEEALYWYFQNT